MSERTVPSVACELCGEPFDPTESGGWCTNPDCGEWQYETYADYDPEASSARESAASADEVGQGQATSGVANDAGATDDTGSTSDPGSTDDREATDEAEVDDDAGASDDGATGAGVSVDAVDEASDGADQESADAASTDSDDQAAADAPADETDDRGGNGDENAVDGDDELADVALEECPECGADVDARHRFCTGCGTDLDDVRSAIAEVTACPDCGEDVGAGDRYCRACGSDVQATVTGAGEDEAPSDVPDELSLEAYGRSIVVTPDDTVGREVRSLMTEAGRPDDEAVRVHREHVRFVRDDGEFHVVNLGENPTAVNGESLEKGDRVRIEPGDELALSEVVTLSIDARSP